MSAEQTIEQRWIPVSKRLPEPETDVLIWHLGRVKVGALFWERPNHEETYKAFTYWDDHCEDGKCWEWHEVTHWQPLPPAPEEI